MRNPIPKLIEKLTGKKRYMPTIEWSSNSWTHNAFRVYEMICGKRWGITTEAWTGEVSIEVNGRMRNVIVHEFFTFEATVAHFETNVREFLSKIKNFDFEFHLPYKLYIYKLQPIGGAPMEMGIFGSPYAFAIAIDATTAVSATNGVSNKTFSHTSSGSDRILWGAFGCSTSTLSSSSYNSVALTRAVQVNLQSSWSELWYLVANATGSNTVSITTAGSNSITGGVFTFTGASQTGVPDATHADASQTSATTSYSHSITTIADNCMIVMSGRANGGATLTAGTNTTVSQPEVAAMGMFMTRSTNPITPAGSATLAMTSASQQFFSVVASFKPVAVNVDVTVNATVLAGTFTIPAYTSTAVRNVTVSPDVLTATFSVQSATEIIDEYYTPPQPFTATFSIPSYSVLIADALVDATVLAMTFSIPSYTPSAVANATVSPSAQVATFTIPAYTVSVVSHITVSPDPLVMTFSTLTIDVRGDYWEDKFVQPSNSWNDKY